jgi:hypothetical protein
MDELQSQLALLPAPCNPDEATSPHTEVIIHHQEVPSGLQPLPYPQNDYKTLIDALPSAIHIENYQYVI